MDTLKYDETIIHDEAMMIMRHVGYRDLLYFCKH